MKKYLIALVMIVMIMSCFFGKTLVMANEESDDTVYNRYYTTIEVEKGDTLWSIAKTYYHHSGMSVPALHRLLGGGVRQQAQPDL